MWCAVVISGAFAVSAFAALSSSASMANKGSGAAPCVASHNIVSGTGARARFTQNDVRCGAPPKITLNPYKYTHVRIVYRNVTLFEYNNKVQAM